MNIKASQNEILQRLLSEAESTQIGRKFNFSSIRDYSTFADQVPIHYYEDLEPFIDKMKQGEKDVLWPGKVNKYAVSAGTTGKGKHMPLSDARLSSDKAFMRRIAFSYIKQRPNPFRLFGKHFSLPGSIEEKEGNRIGEVSGFSAVGAPVWMRPLQLVRPEMLTELSFREKFSLLKGKSIDADIRVITAMPGWILTLFQNVLEETGKQTISDVWSNLNLMICGGAKLENYRPHLLKLAGDCTPDFIETYGASEGYFAFSDDLDRRDLSLVTGNGIFYEFLQDPSPDRESNSTKAVVSLRDVKPGIPYAMVITTNGGLWRYMINDIIEFTSAEPPRILVKGRISEMLDDFGEALYIYEAEEALTEALSDMNIQKSTFTIVSRLSSESELPKHQWLIQFSNPVSSDALNDLAQKIDKKIRSNNRHYDIRRSGGSLGAPEVKEISQNQVNEWIEVCNKTGAQAKLPKILRDKADLLL